MFTNTIKAFANCDHVVIAWSYAQLIPNCIGFALYKAENGEDPQTAAPLVNHIGFAGQNPQPGEQRPSTDWPIQRFTWTDYDVHYGDSVRYMVVPMLINNGQVVKDPTNVSAWSDAVTVGTGTDAEVYFNRGIISSQFMSKQLDNLQIAKKKGSLKSTLDDETSTVTKFLGGVLAQHLFDELQKAADDATITLYASLYELNDGNVIQLFGKIGSRLNLVLANGAFKSGESDENAEVRTTLKDESKVNVYDRIVTGKHFAHNKFIVFCKDGVPTKVWTGSTNLTQNGLYTQVNNALLINNPDVAKWYRDEWDHIQQADNDYPPEYITYNTKGNGPIQGQTGYTINTWFAPVKDQVDLNDARALINAAKEGILFLFFNPGTLNTLYNAIMDKYTASPELFVHGIMNQDPGGSKAPLVFIHKGNAQPTDFDTLLPSYIKTGLAYWEDEIAPNMVTIHSKVVVIDPFGDNPVLMTGSHNLGPKASGFNDDNLNIIKNSPSLAQQYAVNILSVYDHFHWRYSLNKQIQGATGYEGLSQDPNWMQSYLSGPNVNELNFLL